MNKLIPYSTALMMLLFTGRILADPGDSIRIPVFDYSIRGDVKDKWVVFPDKNTHYEKILMYYSLKCDPLNTPYKCGEWDYLTYTYALKKSGKYQEFPNFRVDGQILDSFRFMKNESFVFKPRFEFKTAYTDTTDVHKATVADSNGNLSLSLFEDTKLHGVRFLWRSSELADAGLRNGVVSGIWLHLLNSDYDAKRFIIRLANYDTDSLNVYEELNVDFSICYDHHIHFQDSGLYYFAFKKNFVWDSNKHILVDIQAVANKEALQLSASKTSFSAAKMSGGDDHFLHFEGLDNILISAEAFNDVDKEISIAFWAYGNPDFQAQNDCVFEGIDSNGKRVLNTHLPWGNSRIYWDAGSDGNAYDRIEKDASTDEIKGKWNFWTMTKNTAKGEMKIYKNGLLWHSGTGKSKSMKGIKTFRIGSNATGTANFYDGDLDEFSIWNKCLEDTDIKMLMMNAPDSNHPFYQHLLLYFDINEGAGEMITAQGQYSHSVKMTGVPDWRAYQPGTLLKGFNNISARPDIIFDQSIYTSVTDSLLVIDSFAANNKMLVLYSNFMKPDQPTDTLYVYPVLMKAVFNPDGSISGYESVTADSSLVRLMHAATYDDKFALLDKYEIGRFITPYGINLDMGDGFLWVYDVSDYAPLLFDSVRIQSGNWQELHHLEFVLIEGAPPRDPKRVVNLWNGNPAYNSNAESFLAPMTLNINQDETNVRLKMRTTGHGFGGNENCAEFCPKTHSIDVNGTKRFDHFVWRDNCASNPLYPQGGTWIYNRTNWCPGAEVYTHDFEITPYSTPGDSITVDYNLQPYTWNGQGSTPTWVIASQLVTYGDFNFKHDASIVRIVRPSNWEYHLRENPSCQRPKVIIQNTGSENLSSLKFTYGSPTKDLATFQWTGNLKPLEQTEVELPFYWGAMEGKRQFRVKISEPNGKTDEYSHNNTAVSDFDIPVVYPNKIAFYLRTNNAAHETSWSLTDGAGKVLYSREKGSLQNSTMYIDTFDLPNTFGCFKLQIQDSDGDGLSFWANNDGSGWARFRKMEGVYYPPINPDFGDEVTVYFTTGWALSEEPQAVSSVFLDVFPNPAVGKVYFSIGLNEIMDVVLHIKDMSGRQLYHKTLTNTSGELIEFDAQGLPAWMYFVSVQLADQVITKKLLLNSGK